MGPKDINTEYKISQSHEEMEAGFDISQSECGKGEVFNKPHLVTEKEIQDIKKAKQEKDAKNLEVIKIMEEKLLDANLGKIRIRDIKKFARNEYKYVCDNIKNEHGDIDWEYVEERLSFELPKNKHFLTFEFAVNELRDKLISDNLFSFTPVYVERNCPKAYGFFKRNIKDAEGKIDWGKIKEELHLEAPDGYYESKCIESLNKAILETAKPVTTITDLHNHYFAIFQDVKAYFPDQKGTIDWPKVVPCLSAEARKKLKLPPPALTMESALKKLDDIFKSVPAGRKITFQQIKMQNRALYAFLLLNFKDVKGGVDWKLVSEQSGIDFDDKFLPPKNHKRSTPEQQYENNEEMQKAIGDNKKYLYTFLQSDPGREFEKRNEICTVLINLAKKGNKSAENEIINLISYLADRWVETIPNFEVWKYHKDRELEIIRRCIYNFEPKVPFVGYVYKTLKMASLGLERRTEIEYNDGVRIRHATK